jgi:hypothetical protein
MGSRYLDHDVSLLLLGVNRVLLRVNIILLLRVGLLLLLWDNVGIEDGLAVLNGLLDRVNRVVTLLVVTLHLPVQLGLGNKLERQKVIKITTIRVPSNQRQGLRCSLRISGYACGRECAAGLDVCVCGGSVQICEVCSSSSTPLSALI